jgi:peroxiredoxin
VELPRLESLWRKYRDQGFLVVAIDAEHDTERSIEFITENDLTYHLLEDEEGDDNVVASKLEIYGFPTSYVVGRDGRILFSHIGFEEGDEIQMEQEIRKLLQL